MNKNQNPRLSVAPMMDWTDRHCRVLHRQFSRHALLYTEMVVAAALVRGRALELLAYDPVEHPVALQLGGSDPIELAEATRMGDDAGYDEINLNCGCPSDRVQSGAFGAVLMKTPELVAEIVAAMAKATERPVTVKCRIGVDDQVPEEVLPDFVRRVTEAGAVRVIVHARKAWLQGLSPRENRDVPPLNYPLVHTLKAERPELDLWINGGIETLDQAETHLSAGMDGVMIGRAAYHRPAEILAYADRRLMGAETGPVSPETVVRQMLPYIEAHLRQGGRLHNVTRHMLGLFSGRPGARRWRRILSEGAHLPGAGPELLETALAAVSPGVDRRVG